MSNIDKFSLPLKNGFNSLQQISEIHKNHEGKLHASIAYFNISSNAKGSAEIGAYGFKVIAENELEQYRTAYARHPADPASLAMLQQLETTFNLVKENNQSLQEINRQLKQKTEDFYQHYIADEKIEQTYNPTFPKFMTPEADDFNQRRTLQRVQEKIGQKVEIPHERIRETWGLD